MGVPQVMHTQKGLFILSNYDPIFTISVFYYTRDKAPCQNGCLYFWEPQTFHRKVRLIAIGRISRTFLISWFWFFLSVGSLFSQVAKMIFSILRVIFNWKENCENMKIYLSWKKKIWKRLQQQSFNYHKENNPLKPTFYFIFIFL